MLLTSWKPGLQKERKKEITAYKYKFHVMLLMKSKWIFTEFLQLSSYKNLCCKPETQLQKEHVSVYLPFSFEVFHR